MDIIIPFFAVGVAGSLLGDALGPVVFAELSVLFVCLAWWISRLSIEEE